MKLLKKITDRVYYMDYKESGDRPVLGLVIGDDNSLVIDGGNSKAHAEEFLSYIKKMDIPPLKYLTITHCHWDHIFGAKTMNLINIVNGMTNEKLKHMETLNWTDEDILQRVKNGEEIEFSRENIKIEFPNNDREVDIIKSDIIYDEFLKIDLGGIIVEIERIPCDHSKDCSVVYIPSEKVAFIGDSLYLNMHNGDWSYSNEMLIPMLKELQCYEADYYIPAHHPVYDNKEFNVYSNKLIKMGKAIKDSSSLEEAKKRYIDKTGLEILAEDEENIVAFVNGNKKKNFN